MRIFDHVHDVKYHVFDIAPHNFDVATSRLRTVRRYYLILPSQHYLHNMPGRIPTGRARCSLDVRPSAAAQQAGARRPSVDTHPLTSFAAPAFGDWHSCGHAAAQRGSSALHAVADAQRQDSHQLRAQDSGEAPPAANKLPRVLIAGAGIGGLVLAVALLKRGFEVQIFERDLTAIRGEGKYRGPIQARVRAPTQHGRGPASIPERWHAEGS